MKKVECGVTLWNAHAHNYTNAQTHRQRGGGGRQGEESQFRRSTWETCTSILRPSTTVPCNFSLALSASTLCSNVTNPKPCMQERKRRVGGAGGEWGGGGKEHIIFVKIYIKNTSQYRQSLLCCKLIRQSRKIKQYIGKTIVTVERRRILSRCHRWSSERSAYTVPDVTAEPREKSSRARTT